MKSRLASPSPQRRPAEARTLLLCLPLGTLLGGAALAALPACGGTDDDRKPAYIGATDAAPPRIGEPEDGGAR